MRICTIVDSYIDTDEEGEGLDGAYDLFQVTGTPAEVAKKIQESLETCDLFGGREMHATLDDAGCPLFLTIKIMITKGNPDVDSD